MVVWEPKQVKPAVQLQTALVISSCVKQASKRSLEIHKVAETDQNGHTYLHVVLSLHTLLVEERVLPPVSFREMDTHSSRASIAMHG